MSKRTKLIALLVVNVLLGVVTWQFFAHLKESSLQTEAKVMLSYLATLQNAHAIDKGEFVFFDQYYGAAIGGKDNCQRSESAVELGFILKGCDPNIEKSRVRYAYRVTHSADPGVGFLAEARSGSNASGASFVCHSPLASDQWLIRKDKIHVHAVDCERVP